MQMSIYYIQTLKVGRIKLFILNKVNGPQEDLNEKVRNIDLSCQRSDPRRCIVRFRRRAYRTREEASRKCCSIYRQLV